jgi:hypothetical protein
MRRNRVTVDCIRAIDHDIATGVYPDMTEHGSERDDWPRIFDQVLAADMYSLQHLGYVIPPQADAGWIGEAGPGPSYRMPLRLPEPRLPLSIRT